MSQFFYPLIIFFFISISSIGHANEKTPKFQDGDIIFHISTSAQSKALQLATHSKYSHMGIIYQKKNQYYVYEAIQPVQLTKLSQWIQRGQSGHFVVKRLKNAEKHITPETIKKIKAAGQKYIGKNYDLYFEWSDDKIYCSELVWKIYKNALKLELAQLKTIQEFDLSHPIVKAKMKERYGDQVPLNEPVVSPGQIFQSHLLKTVYEN